MKMITLEVNNSIYDYIMFFLGSIPSNLLKIRQDFQLKIQNSSEEDMVKSKRELPMGFTNPIEIDSYNDMLKRDEI